MTKVLLALLAIAGGSTTTAKFHTTSATSQKYLWEQFKTEHFKVYGGKDEEDFRFKVFLENLKLIDERNAKGDSATHGITKFMDMSPDEFKMTHLNYIPENEKYSSSDKKRDFLENESFALPEDAEIAVDWTGIYTTPVKDQGYCGSCWAFSATEQIESDYMRTTNKTAILSTQQMTSCTKYFIAGGCKGGSTEKGFDYASQKGLEADSNYPYTSGQAGVTGSCSADGSKSIVKVKSYTTVSQSASDEPKMASYVQSTGPLSVCVDASEWSSYTGGIMSVCGDDVDHCVQVVGIDTAAGYWKVRNSWGTSWGESGFIRLAYGQNMCAIASDANYVTTVGV